MENYPFTRLIAFVVHLQYGNEMIKNMKYDNAGISVWILFKKNKINWIEVAQCGILKFCVYFIYKEIQRNELGDMLQSIQTEVNETRNKSSTVIDVHH